MLQTFWLYRLSLQVVKFTTGLNSRSSRAPDVKGVVLTSTKLRSFGSTSSKSAAENAAKLGRRNLKVTGSLCGSPPHGKTATTPRRFVFTTSSNNTTVFFFFFIFHCFFFFFCHRYLPELCTFPKHLHWCWWCLEKEIKVEKRNTNTKLQAKIFLTKKT